MSVLSLTIITLEVSCLLVLLPQRITIGLLGLEFIRRVAVVFDEIVVTVVWIAV